MPHLDPAPMEIVAVCELCGSAAFSVHLQTQDHLYGTSGDWTFLRCNNCGLIALSPRPASEQIGRYYPDLDYHAFSAESGIKSAVIKWLRRYEAHQLVRNLPARARVLEIGCGTGDLLAALGRLDKQLIVTGIEQNPAAAHVARARYGLDVRTGTLDDAEGLSSDSFDRVLMRYVLEHVHHPLVIVKRIADLLKPGASAIFWVPNVLSWDARLFKSFWRGLDAPRHLYLFTPATMRRLLEAAGLHVVAVRYIGVPNDWVGSAEVVLRTRGLIRLSRLISMSNPLTMAAALPLSLAAAAIHRAGRLCIIARR